jgi:hypothetical protein
MRGGIGQLFKNFVNRIESCCLGVFSVLFIIEFSPMSDRSSGSAKSNRRKVPGGRQHDLLLEVILVDLRSRFVAYPGRSSHSSLEVSGTRRIRNSLGIVFIVCRGVDFGGVQDLNRAGSAALSHFLWSLDLLALEFAPLFSHQNHPISTSHFVFSMNQSAL